MQFTSKSLQSAYTNTKHVLESIEKLKDAVSEDIKKLESYLKQYNLTETIAWSIKGSEKTFEQEWLIWNHEKNRLLYRHSQYPFEDCNYEKCSPKIEQEITIEKPLIEMPFDTRKRISRLLGNFLEYIAKTYDETYSAYCPF